MIIKDINICNSCSTKNQVLFKCKCCNKNIGSHSDWVMCHKCKSLYCHEINCIGKHNKTQPTRTDNYGGLKIAFNYPFELTCSNCIDNCYQCANQGAGIKCKFCNNLLCDSCAIMSNRWAINPTFFCVRCAKERL